jgi:hypothetical protein
VREALSTPRGPDQKRRARSNVGGGDRRADAADGDASSSRATSSLLPDTHPLPLLVRGRSAPFIEPASSPQTPTHPYRTSCRTREREEETEEQQRTLNLFVSIAMDAAAGGGGGSLLGKLVTPLRGLLALGGVVAGGEATERERAAEEPLFKKRPPSTSRRFGNAKEGSRTNHTHNTRTQDRPLRPTRARRRRRRARGERRSR